VGRIRGESGRSGMREIERTENMEGGGRVGRKGGGKGGGEEEIGRIS